MLATDKQTWITSTVVEVDEEGVHLSGGRVVDPDSVDLTE